MIVLSETIRVLVMEVLREPWPQTPSQVAELEELVVQVEDFELLVAHLLERLPYKSWSRMSGNVSVHEHGVRSGLSASWSINFPMNTFPNWLEGIRVNLLMRLATAVEDEDSTDIILTSDIFGTGGGPWEANNYKLFSIHFDPSQDPNRITITTELDINELKRIKVPRHILETVEDLHDLPDDLLEILTNPMAIRDIVVMK